MQTCDLFVEAKRPEGEVDQSTYLVPRIKMNGVISPLPHTLSWRAQKFKLLYLPLYVTHFLDQIKPQDASEEHTNRAHKNAY
jgi:hypothetical protein